MLRQSYDLETVVDGVKYKVQATAAGWEKSEFSAEVGKETIPVTNGKIGGDKKVIVAAVDGNASYILSSNSNFNSCIILKDCQIADDDFYFVGGSVSLNGHTISSDYSLHVYDTTITDGILSTSTTYINSGTLESVTVKDCTLTIKGGTFVNCIISNCVGTIEPNASCTFTDCTFTNCDITNLDKFVTS